MVSFDEVPEIRIFGRIHASRFKRIVGDARQLTHRNPILFHLGAESFNRLVRRCPKSVFDFDLQNKLRAALEIQPQADILPQAFPAWR
jgi:hypothetical protein